MRKASPRGPDHALQWVADLYRNRTQDHGDLATWHQLGVICYSVLVNGLKGIKSIFYIELMAKTQDHASQPILITINK